jgi:uncharacterized Fe-S cluster protein YjdI
MKDITRKYPGGGITVIWKPALCIHSTNCWKQLGNVFDPRKHPWVNMDGASPQQIAAQIDRCPSGALSYIRNNPAAEK